MAPVLTLNFLEPQLQLLQERTHQRHVLADWCEPLNYTHHRVATERPIVMNTARALPEHADIFLHGRHELPAQAPSTVPKLDRVQHGLRMVFHEPDVPASSISDFPSAMSTRVTDGVRGAITTFARKATSCISMRGSVPWTGTMIWIRRNLEVEEVREGDERVVFRWWKVFEGVKDEAGEMGGWCQDARETCAWITKPQQVGGELEIPSERSDKHIDHDRTASSYYYTAQHGSTAIEPCKRPVPRRVFGILYRPT